MKTSFKYLLGLLLFCCIPLVQFAQSGCIGDIEPKSENICDGDEVSVTATDIDIFTDYYRLTVLNETDGGVVGVFYGCGDPGVIFFSAANSDLQDWPATGNPNCNTPTGFTPPDFICTNGVSTEYEIRITWRIGPGMVCNHSAFVTVHCPPVPEVSANPDLACVGDLVVYCVDNLEAGDVCTWYNGTVELDCENGCTDPIPYDPADGIYVVVENEHGCLGKGQPVVYLSNGCTPLWCEDNIVSNSTFNDLSPGVLCSPGDFFKDGCVSPWTCSHGYPVSVSEAVNLHAKMQVRTTPNGMLRGDGIRGEGTFTMGINLTGSIQVKTNEKVGELLIVATNEQGGCATNSSSEAVPLVDPNNEQLLWTIPLTGNNPGEWITVELPTVVLNNSYTYVRISPETPDDEWLKVWVDNVCMARTAINCNLEAGAGLDMPICSDMPHPLNGIFFGGVGPYTFLWTPATGITDPFIPNPILTIGPGTHTYGFIVTDANGCTASSNVTFDASPCRVGQESPELDKVFSMYPNPAESHFTLSYTIEETGKLELFDLTGRKILQQEIASHKTTQKLPVSHLSPGVYFARVTVGTEVVHQQKVMIKR